MSRFYFIVLAILLIWSGLSIGGAFIAAPAKFTVSELSMQLGLQVGRAQFLWLSFAEYAFVALLVLCILFSREIMSQWPLLILPIGIFLIQQFGVMPFLNVATSQKIETGISASDIPHTIYIVLECLKLISLILVAYLVARNLHD